MWPVAIAVGVVVAGLVLTKLGRLIRVGGRTLAFLALAAAALLWWRHHRGAADRDVARLRIPLASVELAHATLTPLAGKEGRYALAARVRNRSRDFTLSGLEVALLIKDCERGGPCETTAHQVERIRLSVPPGQARDFRDDVVISTPPVSRGRFAWSHQIVSTEGR